MLLCYNDCRLENNVETEINVNPTRLKVLCTNKGGLTAACWPCRLKDFVRCITRYLKENSLKVSVNPSSHLGGVVTYSLTVYVTQ